MGEARIKKQERAAWPDADHHDGTIDLHVLPAVEAIDGARIRKLTGDRTIPEATQVILRTFRAVVGERTFHVGFCLGDGESFSAIGIAVIERLSMEAPDAALRDVSLLLGRKFADDTLEGRREAAEAAFVAFPRLKFMVSIVRISAHVGEHALSVRLDILQDGVETEPLVIPGVIDRIGSGGAFVAGICMQCGGTIRLSTLPRAAWPWRR